MKRTFQALTLAVALTVSGQTAWAQDLRKGGEALNQDDFASAIEEWRPLAEQGDASAQFGLGTMYSTGIRSAFQRGPRVTFAECRL